MVRTEGGGLSPGWLTSGANLGMAGAQEEEKAVILAQREYVGDTPRQEFDRAGSYSTKAGEAT